MNSLSDLTIIVLLYNSSRVIKDCLDSLDSSKYKIIVVDNASTDNGVEIVEQNFPAVKIIKLQKNIGYGRGNNEGLKIVDTEFALILNPDAIIKSADIKKVLDVLKEYPQAALAAPLTVSSLPVKKEELAEKLADINVISKLISSKNSATIYSAKFIVGAALFMRMTALRKIGFFDQNIFLYFEDDELCFRSSANGYLNLVIPDVLIYHAAGGSTILNSKITLKKNWHMAWSKLYWNGIRRGKKSAKKSAIRMSFSGFCKIFYYAFIFNKNLFLKNLGSFLGAFFYLIGQKAFKKDGTSRG